RAGRGRMRRGGEMRRRLGPAAVVRYQPVRAEPDDGQQHYRHDQAQAGRVPLADLDRGGRLEHLGRPDHPGRAVLGVVRADQRDRIGPDDGGDAANVPAGVKVAAAGGKVVLLDVPDDRFPDPGLVADLADGETGLTAGFCQAFADAHASLHVLAVAVRRRWPSRVWEPLPSVDSGAARAYPPRSESSVSSRSSGLTSTS